MKYPYLSTDEMKSLEQRAAQKYGVSLEGMMQNAGEAVFDVVMNEVIRNDWDAHVLVVSGKGNNGGDALVTARLLDEEGVKTSIFLPYRNEELSPMTLKEARKLEWKDIPIIRKMGEIDFSACDLIIDALFGFSLSGDPHSKEAQIIEQINCSQTPVLSVDVPSGLDTHNGRAGDPAITANYTVTLGMPKKGLGKNYEIVGKLFIGDLGIPPQAYKDFRYGPPLFRGKSYLSVN